MPEDILEIKKFPEMSKISQRLYLKDKYKVNLANIKKEVRVKSNSRNS